MRVIGIESSCDETAVAVYDDSRGLLSHRLYSQIALHQAYGGVVPELASRDHVVRLLPLVREALAAADSRRDSIDGVAYTAGPGLIGALLVGAGFARSLALRLGHSPRSASTISRVICLRRCSKPESARISVSGAAGFGRPHAARRCARRRRAIASSARPSTMQRARHSTRPPRCSDCLTRAAPRWRAWPRPGAAAASTSPVRCSIGPGSISVSVA